MSKIAVVFVLAFCASQIAPEETPRLGNVTEAANKTITKRADGPPAANEPGFMSKLASWIFPFGGGNSKTSDSVASETQHSGGQYLPPKQSLGGYQTDEDCNPCNKEPWIPVVTNYGKNTIIGFMHPNEFQQGKYQANFDELRPPLISGESYGVPSLNYGVPNQKSPSQSFGMPFVSHLGVGDNYRPSGNALVADNYGPSLNNLKPPGGNYGPPLKNVKPDNFVQNFKIPSDNYGPPLNNLKPPSDNYGPPLNNLKPPNDNYGPPLNNLKPPNDNYGLPLNNFKPPSDNYGPPLNNLKPPGDNYGAPLQNFKPPSDNYGPPLNNLKPPSDNYGPPLNNLNPPSDNYGPPVQNLKPPSDNYGTPLNNLNPTIDNHGPPLQNLKPPTDGYGPPIFNGNGGDIKAPIGNYGPPNIGGNNVGSGNLAFPSTSYGHPSLDFPIRNFGQQSGAFAPSDNYGLPNNLIPAEHIRPDSISLDIAQSNEGFANFAQNNFESLGNFPSTFSPPTKTYGPPQAHPVDVRPYLKPPAKFFPGKLQKPRHVYNGPREHISPSQYRNHYRAPPAKFSQHKLKQQRPTLSTNIRPPPFTPVNRIPYDQPIRFPSSNSNLSPNPDYLPPRVQLPLAQDRPVHSLKPIPLPNLSLYPIVPLKGPQDFHQAAPGFNNQNFNNQNQNNKPSGYIGDSGDVQIQQSIAVADYVASIEHPINVVHSPILEVNVANTTSESEFTDLSNQPTNDYTAKPELPTLQPASDFNQNNVHSSVNQASHEQNQGFNQNNQDGFVIQNQGNYGSENTGKQIREGFSNHNKEENNRNKFNTGLNSNQDHSSFNNQKVNGDQEGYNNQGNYGSGEQIHEGNNKHNNQNNFNTGLNNNQDHSSFNSHNSGFSQNSFNTDSFSYNYEQQNYKETQNGGLIATIQNNGNLNQNENRDSVNKINHKENHEQEIRVSNGSFLGGSANNQNNDNWNQHSTSSGDFDVNHHSTSSGDFTGNQQSTSSEDFKVNHHSTSSGDFKVNHQSTSSGNFDVNQASTTAGDFAGNHHTGDFSVNQNTAAGDFAGNYHSTTGDFGVNQQQSTAAGDFAGSHQSTSSGDFGVNHSNAASGDFNIHHTNHQSSTSSGNYNTFKEGVSITNQYNFEKQNIHQNHNYKQQNENVNSNVGKQEKEVVYQNHQNRGNDDFHAEQLNLNEYFNPQNNKDNPKHYNNLSQNPIVVHDTHTAASNYNQNKTYHGANVNADLINQIIKGVDGFTKPELDYSDWLPNQELSTEMTPPSPEGQSFWLSTQDQTGVEITTKKPKQIQIIIPYTTNGNPTKNVGRKVLPVHTQPPTYESVWTEHTKATTPVINIKDLLKSKNQDFNYKNLPFDIIRFQKNIDGWTEQEFANKMLLSLQNQKSTTTARLAPSKQIPEEYLTTQPYNPHEFEITTFSPKEFYDHEPAGSNSKEYQYKDEKDDEVEHNFITGITGSSSVATTTTERQKSKLSWDKIQIAVSPLTKEKVYVVTPQPKTRINSSTENWRNANLSTTFSINILPMRNASDLNDVRIVLSEWPHLINNLVTTTSTTTQRPRTSRHPLFGLMDLSSYAPPENATIQTFSGHSKVINAAPSSTKKKPSGVEEKATIKTTTQKVPT